MQRQRKKGISTVIAVVLLIPVLVLGLGAMTWSLGFQNSLGSVVTQKSVSDIERVNERFEIRDAKIDSSKLNMTVLNTGALPVKLVKMWVTNTTATNGWHQSYDLNSNISPGDSLFNLGSALPITANNASSYKISVISERGSSASFMMFSAKDRAVQMSLFASPRSIPTGQDVTLMFGITNNLTDGIIVQSLKPVLNVTTVEGPTGTITATATLISGPTPDTKQTLVPAETMFFKWVYNIVGDEGDKVDFNATLINAKQGNYLTESVKVVVDSFVEQSSFSLDTLGVTTQAQILVKKDTFAKTNETGVQSVSVGFQPKAVVFFWTRQNAEGNATEIRTGMGFASGPSNERVVAIASDDNAATSNSGKYESETTSIAILLNGTPSIAAEAELQSFDPNGFTLNWITNENRFDIIHYMAFAGTDLTNALASSFKVTADSSDQSVAVGFKPDLLMFMSIDNRTASSAPSEFHVGFASSPSSRGTTAINFEDNENLGSNRDTRVWQRNDRVLMEFSDSGGADMVIDIKSFDSNGFTIKKYTPPTPDATMVHYLALKGGAYKIGSFTKPSTTGIQSVPGVPFRPGALLLMSSNLPTNAAEQGEGRMFIGATDGTRSGAIWFHDKDNLINTDANQRTTTNRLAVHASQSTLRANATLNSFQSDGFRLNWLYNNDSQADEILYVAIGNVTLVYNTAEVQVNMTNAGMNTLWVDRNTAIVFNSTSTGKVYAGIIKKWENVTASTIGNINSTIDSDAWEKNKQLKFYFSEPRIIPGDPGSGESVKDVPGEYYVYVRLSGYDDLGRSIMKVIPLGIGRVV